MSHVIIKITALFVTVLGFVWGISGCTEQFDGYEHYCVATANWRIEVATVLAACGLVAWIIRVICMDVDRPSEDGDSYWFMMGVSIVLGPICLYMISLCYFSLWITKSDLTQGDLYIATLCTGHAMLGWSTLSIALHGVKRQHSSTTLHNYGKVGFVWVSTLIATSSAVMGCEGCNSWEDQHAECDPRNTRTVVSLIIGSVGMCALYASLLVRRRLRVHLELYQFATAWLAAASLVWILAVVSIASIGNSLYTIHLVRYTVVLLNSIWLFVAWIPICRESKPTQVAAIQSTTHRPPGGPVSITLTVVTVSSE